MWDTRLLQIKGNGSVVKHNEHVGSSVQVVLVCTHDLAMVLLLEVRVEHPGILLSLHTEVFTQVTTHRAIEYKNLFFRKQLLQWSS